MSQNEKSLIFRRVDAAAVALMQARDAISAKKVADMASAAEVYAIRQKNDEAARYAHEIKIEALRVEGEYLSKHPKATGGDAQRTRCLKGTESPATLKQQGITKKESSLAQLVSRAAKEAPQVFSKVKSGGKLNDIRRHFKQKEHETKGVSVING